MSARLAGSESSAAAPAYVVSDGPLRFAISVSGQVVSAEERVLTNPQSWRPVRTVVPDGAAVVADEVVAEFEAIGLERQRQELQLEQQSDERRLDLSLADIRNELLAIKERIDRAQTEATNLQARYASLAARPDPTDVALAESRLTLAQLTDAEEQRRLTRAKERRARGFIGAGELARFEAAAQRSAIRLRHAEDALALAREPAPAAELAAVRLQIRREELEIAQLNKTLAKRRGIADIKRDSAQSWYHRREDRKQEIEDDLAHLRVHAPIDGFAVYTENFERALDEIAGKMPRGVEFIRMPNAHRLEIACTIPEHRRSWFATGDPVTIDLIGIAAYRLRGRIGSIADLPRDFAEGESGSWGDHDESSGLKVYDLRIVCDELPADVRPGMRCTLDILGSVQRNAPSLPLQAIYFHDGQSHVAVAGVYRPIRGTVLDDRFLIEDRHFPPGTVIDAQGHFSERDTDSGVLPVDEGSGFSVSGELVPVHTIEVYVGRIHNRGERIAELLADGTRVSAGDLIARLDDDNISDDINKQQDSIDRAKNDLDERIEELALLEDELTFQLELARINLELAEISEQRLHTQRAEARILEATRAHDLLAVDLGEARRLQAHLSQRRLVSERERAEAQRAVRRAELRLERAVLQCAEAEEGPDEAEIAAARLAQQRADKNLRVLESEAAFQRAEKESAVSWARRRLRNRRNWMAELVKRRAALEIRAVTDGVLQHNHIWTHNGLRKVATGQQVYTRFRIARIADTSTMSVRVPVPEHYFTLIEEAMPVVVESASHPELGGHIARIEFLFEDKRRNDSGRGLYSEREPRGETIFFCHIALDQTEIELKPGEVVTVRFPFDHTRNAQVVRELR